MLYALIGKMWSRLYTFIRKMNLLTVGNQKGIKAIDIMPQKCLFGPHMMNFAYNFIEWCTLPSYHDLYLSCIHNLEMKEEK